MGIKIRGAAALFGRLSGSARQRRAATAPADPVLATILGAEPAAPRSAGAAVHESGWLREKARQAADQRRAAADPSRPADRLSPPVDDRDDPFEEMEGDGPLAQARLRERARCTAILRSPFAAGNAPLAFSLACRSTAPRREALAVLAKDAAARGGGPTTTAHEGGGWDAAFARAGVPGRS